MLIVFSLSVCLSVSLSISLYVYSVYDFYNNNNNNRDVMLTCNSRAKIGYSWIMVDFYFKWYGFRGFR